MKVRLVAVLAALAGGAGIPGVALAAQADEVTTLPEAWVRLYDDKGFKDRVFTVKGGTNVSNLDKVKSDDGKKGFGDKTSSVRYQIPRGWKLVLFDDDNHKDSTFELKGTGEVEEVSDLGSFSDKTSSLRWDRD